MIRVTVELVSAIDPKRSRILGIAEIANDGETSSRTAGAFGSYKVRLSKWSPRTNETWRSGRVQHFDRRGRGAWDLLYLALKAVVGERNPSETAQGMKRLNTQIRKER
jgi:hypothetical protein